MEKIFFDRLLSICPDTVIDEPMKAHTTFKIGGTADYFSCPDNIKAISGIIKLCKEYNIPYFVMGNGSNLLISDDGIDGVVICIEDAISNIRIKEDTVVAGAGVLLSKLAKNARDNSLSGLEFASGIPGTLGGAIYMNAGAYGGEMKDIVKSVKYLDDGGNEKRIDIDELEFGYRKSFFSNKNYIILESELKLDKGNIDEISEKMNELMKKRNSKQPVEMPSAGSVFKRPEGHFAGTLIEEAGLKGYSVGGAEVSEKHAGFIVNKGNATAKDVMDLVEHIQKTVREKFGVELVPEIKLVGR